MINKETKYKISSDVVISEINNESVILNLNTGIYFQVNELGSFIISKLKNYQNIAMLQEKIILSFDVSAEACKDDLENFLKILLEKNLLLIK